MRDGRYSFAPLAAVLALIGGPAGALWFVSPLALGFRQWPADPSERWWLATLYDATYFAGIPLLLATPVIAYLLDRLGFWFTARILPAMVFPLFAIAVAVVLARLR